MTRDDPVATLLLLLRHRPRPRLPHLQLRPILPLQHPVHRFLRPIFSSIYFCDDLTTLNFSVLARLLQQFSTIFQHLPVIFHFLILPVEAYLLRCAITTSLTFCSKGTKHFISPTIYATSKIAALPKKKILAEKNEILQGKSSVSFSDVLEYIDPQPETGKVYFMFLVGLMPELLASW